MREDLRWIGRPTPTLESPDKVRGRANFVTDLRLPRMLFGCVLRSPLPHARIAGLDTAAAVRVRGVRAVLTGRDIPPVHWGSQVKDQTALAMDRVRFIGEEVAVVAADDEDAAQEAIERIRVDYEPLPAVYTIDEALAQGAPQLHEGGPGNVAARRALRRGDPDEGLRRSAAVYENVFETSMQYQGYLEPIGTVADVDASGRVTLYAAVQNLFPCRERVAKALEVPVSGVRVIQPHVGGAFGGKMADEPNAILAALLARAAGRPVKLVNLRTEEFRAARPRVPIRIRIRVGAAADGTVLAKQTHILGDAGAYCGRSMSVLNNTCVRMDNCYRIPAVSADARSVYTNHLPTGSFRGMGNPQMVFALEACFDHLAGELGIDLVEFRLRNAVREGDTSVHGWKINSCGLSECIRKAAGIAGWAEHRKAKPRPGAPAGPAKARGMGTACAIHVSGNRSAGNWDGANAEVRVHEDGRATLVIGEGDIGQGANTVLALIAAEAMGLPLEHIRLSPADTDLTPVGLGARASRLTFIAGNAVRRAAEKAKTELLAMASDRLEVAPEDLDIRDGRVSAAGSGDRGITVEDLMGDPDCRPGERPIVVRATFDSPSSEPDETRYGNVSGAYTFTAQAAVVEVDRETGQVDVLRLIAADDIGKALNPLTAEGQVEGAVIQGMGWALFERMIHDGGEIVNGNLADYPLPRAEGSPRVETILVETNDPIGPFGGKGGSETPIDPTAAAIANAVYNAIGIRITSLPITAEKVLKALRDMKG